MSSEEKNLDANLITRKQLIYLHVRAEEIAEENRRTPQTCVKMAFRTHGPDTLRAHLLSWGVQCLGVPMFFELLYQEAYQHDTLFGLDLVYDESVPAQTIQLIDTDTDAVLDECSSNGEHLQETINAARQAATESTVQSTLTL